MSLVRSTIALSWLSAMVVLPVSWARRAAAPPRALYHHDAQVLERHDALTDSTRVLLKGLRLDRTMSAAAAYAFEGRAVPTLHRVGIPKGPLVQIDVRLGATAATLGDSTAIVLVADRESRSRPCVTMDRGVVSCDLTYTDLVWLSAAGHATARIGGSVELPLTEPTLEAVRDFASRAAPPDPIAGAEGRT